MRLLRSTMLRATGWRSETVTLLIALAAFAAPFPCTVIRVHDGDGPLWCAEGMKIRIAGIQAPDFDTAPPCHDRRRVNYRCDNAAAERSRQVVEGLTLHRRLRCRPVALSYRRIVARCTLRDGRSLSCAVLAAGGAVRWDRYWQRYGMGDCR